MIPEKSEMKLSYKLERLDAGITGRPRGSRQVWLSDLLMRGGPLGLPLGQVLFIWSTQSEGNSRGGLGGGRAALGPVFQFQIV